MADTIAFLVKKPAQFDVPLFTYIAGQPINQWRFVVIYLAHPQKALHDQELKASSNWGINLTEGYEWHCLTESPTAEQIAALYKQLGVTLLITNGYQSNYAPFLKSAKQLKIPTGLRIDSVLTGKSTASLLLRKWLMRWQYRSFKGFFTTGKMGADYLDYIGIPTTKQFWFPYCADNAFFAAGHLQPAKLNRLRQQYGLDTQKPVILGVCKFIPRENPADLLEAFIQLNNPTLQLVMVGDGGQAGELHDKASKHPHLSICFPGYVKYVELPFWYALSTVFVHPAQDEPWGVSVQESLAAGCSVVASNKVGSGFDLIVPGKNGAIYPVNNPAALAVELKKALNLPLVLVANTNTQVLEKWNYAAVWEHLQEAAEQIVQ